MPLRPGPVLRAGVWFFAAIGVSATSLGLWIACKHGLATKGERATGLGSLGLGVVALSVAFALWPMNRNAER